MVQKISTFVTFVTILVVLIQSQRPVEARFCGKKLVNLVVKICNGCVYGGTANIKRASEKVFLSSHTPHLSIEKVKNRLDKIFNGATAEDGDESAAEPDHRVSPFMTKRNIVDECCHKTCSYSNLKKYCCN